MTKVTPTSKMYLPMSILSLPSIFIPRTLVIVSLEDEGITLTGSSPSHSPPCPHSQFHFPHCSWK